MPAGSTYTPIATTTLGSAAASVTFSSIAGTYTDLVIVINGAYASSDDGSPGLRFNSDTGGNYSETLIDGNGSSASSGRDSNATSAILGSMSATISTNIINVMNYANTTTYKTSISRGNNTANRVRAYAALWRNTAAITSIQIITNATPNFATGSTFTLYGISAA
jgi:hypothetical protein